MNRIFGTSASKKPKPTLQDAINSVRQPCHGPNPSVDLLQTDTRIASIEVKVKKLDGELMRYKEQMSKMRNGPGKACSPFTRIMGSMYSCVVAASYTTTRNARIAAEEAIRVANGPTCSAIIQHGICGVGYGESSEYDGDSRRHEDH